MAVKCSFEFEKDDTKITFQGTPSAASELLEIIDTLFVAGPDSVDTPLRSYQDPPWVFSRDSELSMELRNSKEYRELKPKINDLDFVCRSIQIATQDVVVEEKKRVVSIKIPDKESWKKALLQLPNHFVKKNVEHFIVHVRGPISEEERQRMADQVSNSMPPVHNAIVTGGSEGSRILVEVVVYGMDVKKKCDLSDDDVC